MILSLMSLKWMLSAILCVSGVNGRSCQCRATLPGLPILPTVEAGADHVPVDPGDPIVKTPDPKEVRVSPELVIDFVPKASEIDIDIQDGFKRLNVVNSCSFSVALGVTGSDKSRTVNGKCVGENIVPNESKNTCFFYLKGIPETLEPGGKWSIDLGPVTQEDDHIFSGNVWASRTDQMESHCPGGPCPVYVGPRAGLTKAEFTLSTTMTDYYDVSNIEAVLIPTSMYPVGVEQDPNDFYTNGVAGGGEWDFNVPSELEKYMVWVIDLNGETCETQADCSPGSRCGVTFTTSPPTFGQCGTFNGYSTAHLACISGAEVGPFECDKYGDAISCMRRYSQHSGYTPGLTRGTPVCGCPDWITLGIHAPPKFPCVISDDIWTKNSLPFLEFLKMGCPSAYTFAFDDATSLFTSNDAREYTVEFCPGDSENKFFL